MDQRFQNALVRVAIGLPAIWVAWDVVRVLIGTLATIISIPPGARLLVTTVFLLAYGIVPAAAMAGCVILAVALIAKYPEENHARSLALLVVSVGLVFGQFFVPTFASEVQKFDIPVMAGFGRLSSSLSMLVFGLGVALAPAWLFWFSASFPAGPRELSSVPRALQILSRLQQFLFNTPAVLLVGVAPVLVVATAEKYAIIAGIVLGVGLASLWLSHRTAAVAVPGRVSVVMASLALPALPPLFWPLSDLLPAYSPFFRFDAMVLLTAMALCMTVFGLAYAVFVQGAVGPSLVVRRGLWVGGTSALVVFLFAGLEELLADAVLEGMGLPGNLGTFISAGIIALGITWVRKKLGVARQGQTAS